MKTFIVIAVVATLSVMAEEYKLLQPSLPCAYQCNITASFDGKEDITRIEVNGRYQRIQFNSLDGPAVCVVRPDIIDENDKKKIAMFCGGDKSCTHQFRPGPVMDVGISVDIMLKGINNRTYEHKESAKYNGLLCDCYYDGNSSEAEAVYVYEDFIYAVVRGKKNKTTFEYSWEAPIEDFKLDEKKYPKCHSSKVYSTPSERYIFCGANSIQVTFSIFIFVLLTALL